MIRTLHMEVENQTHDKLSWDIASDVENQSVAVVKMIWFYWIGW